MPEFFSRGQTSFELIIVAGLVIIVILGALRLVPAVGVSTGRIAVLKSEALKVLSEQDKFYYIAEIKEPVIYTDPDEITIVVGGNTITPALSTELEALNQALVDAKFYQNPDDVIIIVEQA